MTQKIGIKKKTLLFLGWRLEKENKIPRIYFNLCSKYEIPALNNYFSTILLAVIYFAINVILYISYNAVIILFYYVRSFKCQFAKEF